MGSNDSPASPRGAHCRRFRITGRVQGVFFRASTREVARELKLVGCARNMTDGSVEVTACGEPAAVAALEDWLQHGPSAAVVDQVDAEDCAYEEYDAFTTA